MNNIEQLDNKVKNTLSEFLQGNFSSNDIEKIITEINSFSESRFSLNYFCKISISYQKIDEGLSNINEKQLERKEKGVYYTDRDITEFIIDECLSNLNEYDYIESTVFDPTCGSGEFLLSALKRKLLLNEKLNERKSIKHILKTIYGNDLNRDSIFITKLRLFLFILNEYGINEIEGLGKILNKNFLCEDILNCSIKKRFNIIIGNPPYVEEKNNSKYGNIYADVLDKVCDLSAPEGIIGFIIPLSYVSTPRMANIRKKINNIYNKQYLYNYADRPGCLFTHVHQKLTILIAQKSDVKVLYTGNYQYWYNEERKNLFVKQSNILNPYAQTCYIPKLGTREDKDIYEKILKQSNTISTFIDTSKKQEKLNKPSLYLNMRATFWIKAFLNYHKGSEYKELFFDTEDKRNYLYCLLNSSLFWWFWICISDCWHITKKEFDSFKFPIEYDDKKVKELANKLEEKLESTKKYVGTKQVDYEYKHKNCLREINEIDNYINSLYGLTSKENFYIQNYSLNYRIGAGAKNECN